MGRWVKSLTNQANLEILLIPTSPHRRIHEGITEAIRSFEITGGRFSIDPLLKAISLPIWLLDRGWLFDNRLRSWSIRKAIQKFKPHLIHVMETQNGAYPLSLALDYISQWGYRKPPVLLTLFGSDIFWFSRFNKHREKIATVLSQTDYLAMECERDRHLSLELGYNGEFLPISPVGRGISPHLMPDVSIGEGELARRSIAVKGYSGTWGLAHVAIEALGLSNNMLEGLTVEIFSAERGAIRAAKKFLSPKGIKYKIFKKGKLKHSEVLELLRRSILYIGLSRSDGLPSSMLEAMSQGAFPIQTDTACLERWLVDGETGFAVSKPTPQEVSRLVNQALGSTELVKLAKEKNLASIRKNYKLDEGNLHEESIYEKLVSR